MDFGGARKQMLEKRQGEGQQANGQTTTNAGGPDNQTPPNPNPNPPNPNTPPAAGADDDDMLILASLKKRGFQIDSLDQLKNLNAPPPPTPTPEDIAAKNAEKLQAREKKIAEFFVANGGKQEDYDRVQEILKQEDFTSIAKADIIEELQAEGFDELEAERIYKNRYFIKDADSQELFTENEIKLGEKKLKSRAEYAKAKAASILVDAEKKVLADEWVAELKASWTPRVDNVFKELPLEKTFTVIDSNKEEVPITFKMDQADIDEIKALANDPDKIGEIIFNKDKSTNLKRLIELLVSEKITQKLAAHSFTSGESVATGRVEAVFARTPRFGQQRTGSGIRTGVIKGGSSGSEKPKKAGQVLFGANKRS